MLEQLQFAGGLLAVDDPAAGQISLPPTATIALAVAMVTLLGVLTALSIVASKKVETEEDYLVAGRKLSLLMCWGTMLATWFGAEAMTASSENARREGMLGVVLDPLACAATFIFAGWFFAKPLWRMKLVTTSDFFRRTYGTTAEILSSWIQIPSYFGWIALQYQALADVLEVYFRIPHRWGVAIAWGVTLVYTMIGGIWSVTFTECLQIVIALSGLLLLAFAAFSQCGGGSLLAGVERLITDSDPAALTLIPPPVTAAILAYFGAWATGIFGNVAGQDLQQRIFSARDARTAVWACHLTGISYFCFGMIPVSLGLISRIILPDAPETGILAIMVNQFLSPTFAVFFILAFTSMVVSTSTSAILAPATILSHSLLGRVAAFRGQGLLLDRISVFLISLGGIALTFLEQTKMQLLDLAIALTLVALFVPLWMGLYGRPKSEWSAMLAMLLGLGAFLLRWFPENLLGLRFEDREAPAIMANLFIVPPAWYGLGFSGLGYLLGQAVFRQNSPINGQTLHDAWGKSTVSG